MHTRRVSCFKDTCSTSGNESKRSKPTLTSPFWSGLCLPHSYFLWDRPPDGASSLGQQQGASQAGWLSSVWDCCCGHFCHCFQSGRKIISRQGFGDWHRVGPHDRHAFVEVRFESEPRSVWEIRGDVPWENKTSWMQFLSVFFVWFAELPAPRSFQDQLSTVYNSGTAAFTTALWVCAITSGPFSALPLVSFSTSRLLFFVVDFFLVRTRTLSAHLLLLLLSLLLLL